MKNSQNLLIGLMLLALSLPLSAQNKVLNDTTRTEKKAAIVSFSKEEDNRNVMLNADNNTSPRNVNIGLPAATVGMTILENDLPVVYWGFPEAASSSWRQSVSLERAGLLKAEEVASSLGELGYALNSYSQRGTKQLKVKGKASVSHFGWLQGDLNVSGPLTKNGWTFTLGAYLNFDPGTYKAGFTEYTDNTKIFRIGLTKYFGDRGEINILYKYADSYSFSNYAVFEYGENGIIKELSDFKIGRDSYIVRDGQAKMLDVVTGDYYWLDLAGENSTTTVHNFDVFGNHKLPEGWALKYAARLHISKASNSGIIPTSIIQVDESAGYKYADTEEAYSGNVGTQLAMSLPRIPITTIMARVAATKEVKNHSLEFGLLERSYSVDKYKSNRSFFFQSVEDQPRRLISTKTDSDGFFNYNVGSEYHDGWENKLSIFGKDYWKVSDRLKLSYGLTGTYQTIKGGYYLTPRTPGLVLNEADRVSFDKSWFSISGSISATYNIVKSFGLIGDVLYSEYTGKLGDFSGAVEPRLARSRSPLAGIGIFWNNKFLQLISKVTYLTKDNYQTRYNLVNPSDPTQNEAKTIYYSIQTVGWTTDILAKPFKGFDIHFLATLQNPIYKDFTFNAFGQDYDYKGKNLLQVSKVLLEIDPSYSFGKRNEWRVWASFRYFSKQYANLTNVLYFAPRWETFGGVNYNLNKNFNFGLTVINFLNQRGAKGSINGAELITDPTPYYGKLLTGSYITPFTVQFTAGFNF